METALDTKPEFALLCVPRSVMKEWILRLCKLQIPVLCETPPGQDIEELNNLWKEVQILHGKVQVTEQYFLQPYYAAVQNVIDEWDSWKKFQMYRCQPFMGIMPFSIFSGNSLELE